MNKIKLISFWWYNLLCKVPNIYVKALTVAIITFTSLRIHTHTHTVYNSSGQSVLLPTTLKTMLVVQRPD